MCKGTTERWLCKCSNPDCERRPDWGFHEDHRFDRKAVRFCNSFWQKEAAGRNPGDPSCDEGYTVTQQLDYYLPKNLCDDCKANGCEAYCFVAFDDECFNHTTAMYEGVKMRQRKEELKDRLSRSDSAATIRPSMTEKEIRDNTTISYGSSSSKSSSSKKGKKK